MIYSSILGIIALGTLLIWLKRRKAVIAIFYEICGALYFCGLTVIQAFGGAENWRWWWFAAVPVFILTDMWMFFCFSSEEIFPEMEEIGETEEEIGRVIGTLIMAPAYFIGVNLLYDAVKLQWI